MSPIEKKMHAALLACVPSTMFVDCSITDTRYGNEDSGWYAVLDRDEPILTYRADFVITTNDGRRLVVECDGHDFHDRTKQQAAYDRARDRELLRLGILTARFTGSEIHHAAERCAAEAWAIVATLFEAADEEIRTYSRTYKAGRDSVLKPKGL